MFFRVLTICLAIGWISTGHVWAEATETIVSVDFDSLATGGIDASTSPTHAEVDSATTGGSWATNSSVASHEIQADGGGEGDLALVSYNGASTWGAQLDFDNVVDIDEDLANGRLEIRFESGTRHSTGFTRDHHWQVRDGSTLVFELEMDDGTMFLDGPDMTRTNMGTLTGAADSFRLRPWDSTDDFVLSFTIIIEADGGITATVTDNEGGTTEVSALGTISTTADLDNIRSYWAEGGGGNSGIYFNDLTVIRYFSRVGTVFTFR